MPIYEYDCAECGRRFEIIRSHYSADDPLPCAYCSSDQTKRILSTFYSKTNKSRSSGSSCNGCSGRNCSTCH